MRPAAQTFLDPFVTLDGSERASVGMTALETLWFNTGTLCNLACSNCYIESSPLNDRLVYLSHDEVRNFLNDVNAGGHPVRQIGFTGGEPFMNPDIIPMLSECLSRGYNVLVLTNAMRPMMRWTLPLEKLSNLYGRKFSVRVSLDHYSRSRFEAERGNGSWLPTMGGIKWLAGAGIDMHIAARKFDGEDEESIRLGFNHLFDELGIALDAMNASALVVFPEMDQKLDVPEITKSCWQTLNVDPADMMCATSRMVVKEKGNDHPHVMSCTLLPHEAEFQMGARIADALGPVQLNHRHCATFCVLGGGTCAG